MKTDDNYYTVPVGGRGEEPSFPLKWYIMFMWTVYKTKDASK